MATQHFPEDDRGDSPDSASRATAIYDATGTEGELVVETDDDDMDFEPAIDESEYAEFFNPNEEMESEFHGILLPNFDLYHDCFAVDPRLRLF